MAAAGLPVPPGFVVTAAAFAMFLDHHRVAASGEALRRLILDSSLPGEIGDPIRLAYDAMGSNLPVAVRSSALCEDGETASFAGQQESFLNVCGADAVVRRVQECWSSFFTPRALFYRAQKGAITGTGMAVVVQEMVFADKSGVLFTADPVEKLRDRMVIEAVFGLGDGLVSGQLTPDHYVLDRNDASLLREWVPIQKTAIVHDAENGGTREIALPNEQGRGRVLSQDELESLWQVGLRLETLFESPQDVEWCIRGSDLLLVQSRPITTL